MVLGSICVGNTEAGYDMVALFVYYYRSVPENIGFRKLLQRAALTSVVVFFNFDQPLSVGC